MCEKSSRALVASGESLEKAAEFLDALAEGRVERDDVDAIRDACANTADAMHVAYVAARAARAEGRECQKLRALALDFVAASAIGTADRDRYAVRFAEIVGRYEKSNAAQP